MTTEPNLPAEQDAQGVLRETGWICLRRAFSGAALAPFRELAGQAYPEVDGLRRAHGETAYLQHLSDRLRYVPTASSFALCALFPGLSGWLDDLPPAVRELLHGELGERVTCDLDQSWMRRQYAPGRGHLLHRSHAWHQDGALGYDFSHADTGEGEGLLRMLVCWVPLTPCGADAPGLELLERRIAEVIPARHLNDAWVLGAFPREEFRRPVMEAGDMLLFAGDLLHQTHVTGTMGQDRTSIEFRFFDAAALPRRLCRDRFHEI